jgi:ABC-2 type transport system ATP-binding protein
MIDCRDVVKTFPQHYGMVRWLRASGRMPRRTAIDGVSFSVERGELFGLLGANGSGKSTILRMLAGLISPDAGAITIAGVDVIAEPVRARACIGLSTGDERSFYHRFTAGENIELYAGLCGVPHARRRSRVEDALRAVDLHGDLNRRFDTFSSGMKQRLAIARALVADPDVLLLDEPTRAVDPVHAEHLRALVRDELVRQRGKTVVLATNLLDEAWTLCDRIAVMRAGRAIAVGRGDELRARAAGRRRYSIAVDRVDDELLLRLRAVDGMLQIDRSGGTGGLRLRLALDPRVRSLNELLTAMSANGIAVTAIGPEEISAAELFDNLTGGNINAG